MTDPDTWFFACFVDTAENLGGGSQFREDYAAYAGYDLEEKELLFLSDIYCDSQEKPREISTISC